MQEPLYPGKGVLQLRSVTQLHSIRDIAQLVRALVSNVAIDGFKPYRASVLSEETLLRQIS